MPELSVSSKIEERLVALDHRGMRSIRSALKPGYVLRAATLIREARRNILIGTGFPVEKSFETDGPLGAIALYKTIEKLGANPIIVCSDLLARSLRNQFQVIALPTLGNTDAKSLDAAKVIKLYSPELIICIEAPGIAKDGKYYNIQGVDISSFCVDFDSMVGQAFCKTVAIGDGGNEVGMAKVWRNINFANTTPCVTGCDELVVADISNWGAHGLIAMLSSLAGRDFLADWDNLHWLNYLSMSGSLDGISGKNTLTEDGYPSSESDRIVADLRKIVGFE